MKWRKPRIALPLSTSRVENIAANNLPNPGDALLQMIAKRRAVISNDWGRIQKIQHRSTAQIGILVCSLLLLATELNSAYILCLRISHFPDRLYLAGSLMRAAREININARGGPVPAH